MYLPASLVLKPSNPYNVSIISVISVISIVPLIVIFKAKQYIMNILASVCCEKDDRYIFKAKNSCGKGGEFLSFRSVLIVC